MDFSIANGILEKILKISNIDVLTQYNKYINYWPILLFGFVSSFLLIPIIGKLAVKWGATYKPNSRRKNKDSS